MPARKPVDLHKRHNTKGEVAERKEAEAAVHPDRGFPKTVPAPLKKNKVAGATWRRLMREYDRVEAELASRLDMDLLFDYCHVMGQIDELDHMRSNSYAVWEFLCKQRLEFIANNQFIEALSLVDKIQKAYEVIIKVDARVDAKRKLVFSYRQSLFLTPRSRTGVAPSDKKVPPPEDPMEALMNEALEQAHSRVSGDEK